MALGVADGFVALEGDFAGDGFDDAQDGGADGGVGGGSVGGAIDVVGADLVDEAAASPSVVPASLTRTSEEWRATVSTGRP